MYKIKLTNILKNHVHIIGLFLLILITILTTNLYYLHKKNQINSLERTLDNIYLKKSILSIIKHLEPRYETINFKIESGDTFEKILKKVEIPKSEQDIILKKISKFKFINNLYKNQKILFKIDRREPIKILKFSIQTSKKKKINFYEKYWFW